MNKLDFFCINTNTVKRIQVNISQFYITDSGVEKICDLFPPRIRIGA